MKINNSYYNFERKCVRFPRLRKLKILSINEAINLTKYGGEFTTDENTNMKKLFGEAVNLIDGGWILPDGYILDFKRSKPLGNGGIRHSKIYDAFSDDRKKLLTDIGFINKELADSDSSPAIDIAMAFGMIRYYLSDSTFYCSIEKIPTQAQFDKLYDIIEYVDNNATQYWNGIIECNGKHITYSFDKFVKKFVNDIKRIAPNN